MRAIRISEWGGPEVLELVDDAPEPEPGEHDVLIRVSRAGINFADTHARENSYLARYELPLTPGAEVAGVAERDGHGFTAGQRVVALVGTGGYAERVLAPPLFTYEVPDGVDDGQALAIILQGTTAWHLLRTCAHMKEGESVVVHAAAGGVGSLAIQLAKRWGAGRVIAAASSEDKRQLTLDLGADAAIDARAGDMKAAIEEANGGNKVDIVLEMVGGSTFDGSLAALAPFGRLVFFGMAGRERPSPVDPGSLMQKSRSVIGFWLMHCMARPQEMLAEPIRELLEMVAAGELRPVVGGTYPLSEARRAHEDMRARKTTGKIVIDPRG
jgi:NADPH2:quinone reductase